MAEERVGAERRQKSEEMPNREGVASGSATLDFKDIHIGFRYGHLVSDCISAGCVNSWANRDCVGFKHIKKGYERHLWPKTYRSRHS